MKLLVNDCRWNKIAISVDFAKRNRPCAVINEKSDSKREWQAQEEFLCRMDPTDISHHLGLTIDQYSTYFCYDGSSTGKLSLGAASDIVRFDQKSEKATVKKPEFIKSIQMTSSFFRKKLFHLNLQLLYSCNFHCKICDFWKPDYQNKPRLSLDQIRIMEEKLRPLGPLVVSIGGGEPLLHEDLIEITRTLSQRNFPVMICNGWFITPDNARELYRAGMREVSISVDYASAAKHDAQRGREGAFDRAITALQTLAESRTHPAQRVHMISVVMDDNLEEIEQLIRIAKSIGVTYLITFYSNCRGEKNSRVSRGDVSDYLLSLKKKYPEFIALSEFIRRFKEAPLEGGIAPCYAGKNLFNIDCQGNVTRCIDHLDEEVGNIFEHDLDSIRRRLAEKAATDPCGSCWTSCRGNIETMLYGKRRLKSYREYHSIVRHIPLVRKG
jgi:radical SAM protein with 4Fe4S-binding SPASM domain